MGCNQSRQSLAVEEVMEPVGSTTKKNLKLGQPRAKDLCCGNQCCILGDPHCCEHTGIKAFGYCYTCRTRQLEREHATKMAEKQPNAQGPDDNLQQDGEHPEECPICLEPGQARCFLPCGHWVCDEHLGRIKHCPLCRRSIGMQAESEIDAASVFSVLSTIEEDQQGTRQEGQTDSEGSSNDDDDPYLEYALNESLMTSLMPRSHWRAWAESDDDNSEASLDNGSTTSSDNRSTASFPWEASFER